ncbi:MAG: aspartate kinase [Bacteroidota bacterium]
MKVFKFGGASVKDADGVKNVAKIIRAFPSKDLVVIISAMGKMTNAFEALMEAYTFKPDDLEDSLSKIRNFHFDILDKLNLSQESRERVEVIFSKLEKSLERPHSDNFDYDYDQIVSYGEVLSTTIVSSFLNENGVECHWADARLLVRTDSTYREARVDWEKTETLVGEEWAKVLSSDGSRKLMLTQGFIGHTPELTTTTLGREGSDFSAAIFSYVLKAEDVTIWKDVPGVLNADPKYFSDAVMLKRISYKEAIELAYYGASVIHPKTIKPLQNKGIVLKVKSFLNHEEEGTRIDVSTFSDSLVPSYIFKVNQILISFTPRDFSFVNEDNLSELFGYFVGNGIKINLMQNSALNFSICVEYDEKKLGRLMAVFSDRYEVFYNRPCELVTIRHYDQETISRLLIGKKVLVEQKSRNTARMVLMEG